MLLSVLGFCIFLSDLNYIAIFAQMSKESVSAPTVQTPTATPISTSTAKVPTGPAIIYTPLSGFSWDQDNDKVKVKDFKPPLHGTIRI